jgi:AcrR family transcriptional regulator
VTSIVGRRERKRQRTRSEILSAARELFAERGYHETSLAEISELADVATSTVSSYFPTKSDILFDGIAAVRDDYIRCITSRNRSEETAIEATTRWHNTFRMMSDNDVEWMSHLRKIVRDDPVLAGHQQQLWKPGADALAHEIAIELGDDPRSPLPNLIAAIKVAVYSSLAHFVLDETESIDETAAQLVMWNDYANNCLTAAADAIAKVPLPLRHDHTRSLSSSLGSV